jgi:phosphate-selective porin
MRKIVKTGAAALMLTCMAGNVWAAAATAAGCARPVDMSALQTAAKQQRLMVAALSCNAAPLYNDFVKAYQKELQDSDKALQAYFRRLNSQTGTADYHAYKTRMANSSSMQSIHDITGYCASAKAAFEEALGNAKLTLASFVSDTTVDDAFAPCQFQTAGSVPEQKTPPRAKPVQTVIPAQGSGLATSK